MQDFARYGYKNLQVARNFFHNTDFRNIFEVRNNEDYTSEFDRDNLNKLKVLYNLTRQNP